MESGLESKSLADDTYKVPGGLRASVDILVVDDNPANLLAVETALDGLGSNVVCAHSGAAALHLLLERDFALILLDVKMPSLGGIETARLIRQRKRSHHTPIIFVTAYSREDTDVSAAYRLGAVDFLFKPIIPEILRAKASVFVELQKRSAEVAWQASQIQAHVRREHTAKLEEEKRRWQAEAVERRVQELAAADRRKDEFLAVLSHELRNPLAPILNGVALLQRQLDGRMDADSDVKARRVCERIERQARYLIRLVDDLLDVSRINSGKIELRKSHVIAQDIIAQAVTISRPYVDDAGHELTLKMPTQSVVVCADSVRMIQVIANLLNNSARYTPPGGHIHLAVDVHERHVRITVVDNGRGIETEFLPHIFDMFAQAPKAAIGGLGIGLSLVRTLVDMHGGTVSAHSEGPGTGSTFTVTLPVAQAPRPASEAGAIEGATVDRAQTLVVVDDNSDVRESLAELLIALGHSVHTAPDGEAGVELIVRIQPDLAFVDVGMPKLDGLGVARRVRASRLNRPVRLIAMTGFGQDADRQKTHEAGFDAHLVKPASLEAIVNILAFKEH